MEHVRVRLLGVRPGRGRRRPPRRIRMDEVVLLHLLQAAVRAVPPHHTVGDVGEFGVSRHAPYALRFHPAERRARLQEVVLGRVRRCPRRDRVGAVVLLHRRQAAVRAVPPHPAVGRLVEGSVAARHRPPLVDPALVHQLAARVVAEREHLDECHQVGWQVLCPHTSGRHGQPRERREQHDFRPFPLPCQWGHATRDILARSTRSKVGTNQRTTPQLSTLQFRRVSTARAPRAWR